LRGKFLTLEKSRGEKKEEGRDPLGFILWSEGAEVGLGEAVRSGTDLVLEFRFSWKQQGKGGGRSENTNNNL